MKNRIFFKKGKQDIFLKKEKQRKKVT